MDAKGRQLPLFHLPSRFHVDSGSAQQYWKWRSVRGIVLVAVGMMIISASYFRYGRLHSCHGPPLVLQTGSGLPSEDFQRTWAQYSPYFPATEYRPPPDKCSITQVCPAY